MFAYGSVRAMFLGLKFHLKAIFFGLKFVNMNFPFFFLRGGRIFSNCYFLSVQLCNTSKIVPCYQVNDKIKLSSIFLGRRHAGSIFLGLNLTLHTHTPVYKYSK